MMDKKQELLKRLYLLVQEIDKAKKMVDDEKSQYLNNYIVKKILYSIKSNISNTLKVSVK